jgi:hypothetical protein
MTREDKDALQPIGKALRAVALDAGAQKSAEARDLVRASLTPAIRAVASTMNDHPLSVAQLAAKMLLEQLFALDADAARAWCDAAMAEEIAADDDARLQAQRDRLAAFDRLAKAQNTADEKKRAGPFDLRLFI